ncbi:MAG: hypothetical protein KME56_12390 [Candidatus Thiodiazotropha sp. (ex Ctena orbiculata)]|nr:hypothetical protein [Candidatus Thiodiazotropha taylori]MBT2997419.1 hypothetical protein [Candidatus Thiodiazotropha taylori]MBT3001093.1 hypothetical protein [Candidatus Thiodiazotropha taylori]MBV2111940.1 hypothetical protein [Candidatus Thiodiazotropha taylori]
MVAQKRLTQRNEGTNWMSPDILHAAKVGDYSEALAAIKEDADCINQLNDTHQNALQVALINFHEDIAFLLLDETNISVKHKDALGRDSLDLALFGASEELCERINDRWYEEPDPDNNLDQNKHDI